MLSFRVAGLADRELVEAIFGSAFAQGMAGIYDAEMLEAVLPKVAAAQDALLESGTFLIGTHEGVPVAVGGWTSWAPGTKAETPGLAHVRHVAADPERAPKGAGRALVERLMGDARAAGFVRVEALSTLNAAPFYARLGFVEQEKVDVPIGDGVVLPSIRMEARLP